ncbi:MAG: hypothetical protein IPP76_11355 [Moraxellaceae bacterium]|jgi:hypothetical protein|nr:hypothetical protein [Moraxellaceae bacterium]MBL0231355.1 hypothetical protein [Moraxellaceae bacterium]
MSIENYRCPHCNLMWQKLKVSKIPAEYQPIGVATPITVSCVVYSCQSPTCGKAISIQADPIQQRNDIAAAVVAKIKGY